MAVVILHVHKYEKETRKFISGGLHEKHIVASWKLEPSQHSLIDTGKRRI